MSKHYYNGRNFKFIFQKTENNGQLKNVEENIYSSAVAIRKELEECTYNTSWPSSCDELDMDCFPVSPSLRKFLSLVNCNDAAPNNDKTERIISLSSQGLFYAVHQRKKLTPGYSPPTFNRTPNLLPQSQDWDMVCLIQNWEKLSLKWRSQELTITSME